MNELIRDKIKQSKTLRGPFPSFDIEKTPNNPHCLFEEWFQFAIDNDVYEPHSMTLSTVDKQGYPDSRVLILKDIDEEGWYFATSSLSKKGEQLRHNPNVSLCFYWSIVGRQIRIRGTVKKMSQNLSSLDFMKRGTVAKAVALIEKQSQVLEDPAEFENALTEKLIGLKDDPSLVSSSWSLYQVDAREVEYWQANEDRKHIRLVYRLDGDRWTKNILWP
ncbi:pyridoxine/pyridoxamine 5'-phosphate oxidase [Paenibacillus fonticola]|uniref:pyridoxine/pyridoxamine 5'-phosphate oxidase n=1 Tax=Paenibacillus fonticola TaxID=379896 RepID=UPI0003758D8E|nr:pyridoxal 5'-phosphate synthase [Paenibacillus fonticola]